MGLFLVEAALNGIVSSKEELNQKASEFKGSKLKRSSVNRIASIQRFFTFLFYRRSE